MIYTLIVKQRGNNEESKMSGFIKRQEVIDNAELVIELYGQEVFDACMVAPETETFLGLLSRLGKI